MGSSQKSIGLAEKAARFAVLVSLLVGVVSAASDDGDMGGRELTDASRRALDRAVGNADPALPQKLVERIGPAQVTVAFYKGTRRERLVALDAAFESREDPFYVASSLAALMGAEDRQTASRAAHALDGILRRATRRPDGFMEVVPGQAAQLKGQLAPLAGDPRLDLDIRIVAMAAVDALKPALETPDDADAWLRPLLADEDVVVRRQAVGLLTPPLDDELVVELAKMVTDDPVASVRGQAAVMLCENALAHDVKDPTDDLAEYLKSTLQTRDMPIEAIGGMLACLHRFEGEKKTALIEIAVAHPDPAVKAYYSRLKKKK